MTVTISEFAEAMNVPYIEAYMFLKTLEKQGTARVIGKKRTGEGRGRPAHVYAVASLVIDPPAVDGSKATERPLATTHTWFVSPA